VPVFLCVSDGYFQPLVSNVDKDVESHHREVQTIKEKYVVDRMTDDLRGDADAIARQNEAQEQNAFTFRRTCLNRFHDRYRPGDAEAHDHQRFQEVLHVENSFLVGDRLVTAAFFGLIQRMVRAVIGAIKGLCFLGSHHRHAEAGAGADDLPVILDHKRF
jgi:hypothetical protein